MKKLRKRAHFAHSCGSLGMALVLVNGLPTVAFFPVLRLGKSECWLPGVVLDTCRPWLKVSCIRSTSCGRCERSMVSRTSWRPNIAGCDALDTRFLRCPRVRFCDCPPSLASLVSIPRLKVLTSCRQPSSSLRALSSRFLVLFAILLSASIPPSSAPLSTSFMSCKNDGGSSSSGCSVCSE